VNNKSEYSQDDQFLIERILNGDTNAFSIIIKNTEGLVAQIIFKMIPNKEDRKDIAQEVYLKAFRNLKNFRFQSKLSTWIGQISYNACFNFLEKKKPILPDNLQGEDESYEEPLEKLSNRFDSYNNQTEMNIYQKELSEILRAGLENLPPVYKTLITLFHNEELSYAEIGQITDLPEGTVKNYLFRARKALRDNILLTYNKEAL
jgi:RNA polymerase sigma-70 factor (ECF subfamily)